MTSEEPLTVNTAVNMQLVEGRADQIRLIDGLELTAHMRDHVLLPYLEALWKSLGFQSDARTLGVRRSAFIEVLAQNMC